MEYISFEDFVFEREILKINEAAGEYNHKKELILALIESGSLDYQEHFVLENITEHELFEQAWEGTISEEFYNEHLNESKFGQWIQDKGAKAIDAVKTKASNAKDKSVQIASKILKSFGTFSKFILENIKKFLVKAWEVINKQVNARYAPIKEKVIVKSSKALDGKADSISKEVKNLGQMTKSGYNWVAKGAVNTLGKGIQTAGSTELKESFKTLDYMINLAITESVRKFGIDFINEISEFEKTEEQLFEGGDALKIPGLSKLAHIIADLPFYKQLHKFEHAAAKYSNMALSKTSYLLNKIAGAPGPFEFVIFGTIVGIVSEAKLKSVLKSGVSEILKMVGSAGAEMAIALAIPIVGYIIKVIFKIAGALWYYGIGQAIASVVKGEIKDIKKAIEKSKDAKSELKDEAAEEKSDGKEEKK